MIARKAPEALPDLALTKAAMRLLNRAVPTTDLPTGLGTTASKQALSAYFAKATRVGGYLACTRDPLLGNFIM